MTSHPGEPAPLAGDAPDARQRLGPDVVPYWRWRMVASAVPALVLVLGVAWALPIGVPGVAWWIFGGAALLLVASIVVIPPMRYRVFWIALSPTEIDIQHGIVFVKRTVVPIQRVQSLRTERGPIADHYRMTTLHIRTAGGSVSVVGLGRSAADDLCARISRLAELRDTV